MAQKFPRLHLPGQPDPNLPQPAFIQVQDQNGNTVNLPLTAVGLLADSGQQQIYQVVRAAIGDGLKDFVVGFAGAVLHLFSAQENPMQRTSTDTQFRRYRRTSSDASRPQTLEMRPWQSGDEVTGSDRKGGTPKDGDYIARDPQNPGETFLLRGEDVAANYQAE